MATTTITLGAGESSGNNRVAGEMIIIISIMSMLVVNVQAVEQYVVVL